MLKMNPPVFLYQYVLKIKFLIPSREKEHVWEQVVSMVYFLSLMVPVFGPQKKKFRENKRGVIL